MSTPGAVNDLTRSRVWLASILNENSLECYLVIISTGECYLVIISTGECYLVIISTGECYLVIISTGECYLVIISTGECYLVIISTGECYLFTENIQTAHPGLVATIATNQHTYFGLVTMLDCTQSLRTEIAEQVLQT